MRKLSTTPTAGLKIIGYFVLLVLLSETATMYLGGDTGGFIWVTFHFIINPVLGITVILFVIWHTLKQSILWLKVITIVACIAPLLVIYIGYTGNFWIYKALDLRIHN